MDLQTRFVTHVRASGLLPPGTSIAVACSGGSDSVALLLLLVGSAEELGLGGVSAAHLDHGLRDGSRDDARFVVNLADRLRVPLRSARIRVRRAPGESPEAAARRVRYAFLARAARHLGADVVATAHQQDDQAETVLYRAIRGTGIDGLRGILPTLEMRGVGAVPTVRVVRPLLPFRRCELRDWLGDRGETWVEDPTNEGGNDRARIRNEILPLIRSTLGRDAVPPLARLATNAQRTQPGELRAQAPLADGTARAKRRRPMKPTKPTRGDVTCERRRLGSQVFLERLRARPGSMELLAAEGVRGTLHVRVPRRGDRFHALGLPKPQRLGHYLQRRGVPHAERATALLLCDDEGIVWVVGHGIAARVALGIETRLAWVARRVEVI